MKVEIVPVGGSPVPIHHHNGEMFAEAPASGDYVIRLTNSTPDRVEAVLSVDGIDACNGKDANFSNRGRVLHAWQTIDIKGWFRTHEEVAAFQFAKAGSGKGYAEKTGRGTEHVGVIGVAVFKEKQLDPIWILMQQQSAAVKENPTWIQASGWRGGGGSLLRSNAVYRSSYSAGTKGTKGIPTASVESTYTVSSSDGDSNKVTCSASLDTTPSDVSTGYGKKTEMHSSSVSFSRASETPSEVLALRYATRAVLKSWGVPLHGAPTRPNPFPGNPGVPAPTGWRG